MARARQGAGRSANTNPVTHDALVKLARKDMGHSGAAAELGVTVGQISSSAWSKALVDAGRYSTAPATSASVRKLKDVENNRWELIAARTGETMARVKELYGSEDDVSAASARGRGNRASSDAKAVKGPKKPAAKKSGGKVAQEEASPRRARTRAERARARSGNPS